MRRLKPRQSRHRHRRHHDRVFFPFFYLCVQSGYGTRILFPRRNNVTCSVLYVCARLYYIILLLLYYSIYSRSYYFFDIVCAVSRTSSYEGAQRKRRIPFLQVSRPMSELVKRAYISPLGIQSLTILIPHARDRYFLSISPLESITAVYLLYGGRFKTIGL